MQRSERQGDVVARPTSLGSSLGKTMDLCSPSRYVCVLPQDVCAPLSMGVLPPGCVGVLSSAWVCFPQDMGAPPQDMYAPPQHLCAPLRTCVFSSKMCVFPSACVCAQAPPGWGFNCSLQKRVKVETETG